MMNFNYSGAGKEEAGSFGMSNTNSAREEEKKQDKTKQNKTPCQDTAASHDDCTDDAQHPHVCFVCACPSESRTCCFNVLIFIKTIRLPSLAASLFFPPTRTRK